MTHSFASPPIPLELVREILEMAASSNPVTAATLTKVSSHFRQWTLPVMYDTVVLSTNRSVARFHAAITLSPNSRLVTSPVPLSRYVKNLAILTNASQTFIGDIITICSQVRTLACNFPVNVLHRWYSKELSQVPPIREQHLLGISCRDTFDQSFLLQTTTHLHMQLGAGSISLLGRLKERLCNLTHLAITFIFPASELFKALGPLLSELLESETLQVLLVQDASLGGVSLLVEDINEWNCGECKGFRDIRLVAMKVLHSPVRQWKEDTPLVGTSVLWRVAEVEIDTRK